MKSENYIIVILQKIIMGIVGFLVAFLGVMGYYPLIPAFYGTYCLDRKKNILVYVGLFMGMFFSMSFQPFMKYLLIIGVINIGIRVYWWANRTCSGWIAGIISGVTTAALNCSCALMVKAYGYEMTLGIGEGFIVAGATVLMHYIIEMIGQLEYVSAKIKPMPRYNFRNYNAEKTEAFAVAVEELSNAFKSMDVKTENENSRKLELLEQEITGRLCACCEDCTMCWNENRFSLSENIRKMLAAVVSHNSREEIWDGNYVHQCNQYKDMVNEAIEAFGRIELNEAWHKRLQENRLVIAGQLNAMSDLLHGWNDESINCDDKNKTKIARIAYEAKERGILTDEVHIYADAADRLRIDAVVMGKWNGGIPMKNYRLAVEKAMGMDFRVQKDAKSIITKNAELVSLYEDTRFYTLPGIATQKKNDSAVSGDSFVMFELDNGKYNVCISDGMGSGNDARRESEMVVDLMEKFMEAGFMKETAVRLMNSAMVLQGTKESYSTLDFAQIDLYDGQAEILKVGASASFIKRGDDVRAISSETLPAGFDINQELSSVKKHLQDGDFLVMVTDGVLEYLHTNEPEDRLSEIISEIKTDNAGVLARSILESVLKCTGGYAIDDMTVLATGIWEK